VPVVRCRLLYNTDITKIEFFPYHIRPIQSIELVENNEIDYALKFANRVSLDILKKDIDADEIIIVKNQLLTDTTYTNIALYDGKKWQTPAFPLLKGTKRTYLLEKKIIFEQDILANNIKAYSNIRFFNGMINWEEAPSYPIQLLLQKRTK
jgi:4-amino-4-deoxychorismate lyase